MPMGTDDHPFNGIFDGADYTVDYMHINATAEKYAGLVGKADGAEIKNIKIGENSRISSAQTYLGAVAGAVSNTLVTNCHNAANLTSTAMYVGGVYFNVFQYWYCYNHSEYGRRNNGPFRR